jgi:hypothetical protein
MKLGIATVITDEGIRPDVLGKALEDRGYDSLVVAEHSHIPASRATLYPAGGELPLTAATVPRARRHHGGWMPMAVPGADMVPAQLSLLEGATDIPVSVIVPERVERAVLDAYRQYGAERAFIMLSTKPETETLRLLDSIAALTEIYG